MEMKTKEMESIKVVGMEIETSVQECIENNKAPDLWKRFMDRVGEIKNRVNEKVWYGLSLVTGECSFRYIACVEVSDLDNIPEGMVGKEVPKSKYAVWTHKGKLDKLTEAYRWLYEEGMPKSGLKQKKEFWLELCDERFKEDSDDSEMDICIPIEE